MSNRDEQHYIMQPAEMMLHLITSIRNLDSRIDELRRLLCGVENKDKVVLELPVEVKTTLRARVEGLFETRMCLVYSMMDLRAQFMEWARGEEISERDSTAFYNGLIRRAS